jgi:hypothetical protein
MDGTDNLSNADTSSGGHPQRCAGRTRDCGCDLPKLKAWCDKYTTTRGKFLSLKSPVIMALDSDELDVESISEQVRSLMPPDHPVERFCSNFQELFDNWVEPGDELASDAASDTSQGWEHALTCRRASSVELEASMRNSCRFCTFLMQVLIDNNSLEVLRKIEGRICHFIKSPTMSVSLQNWGVTKTDSKQLMWLNFPHQTSSQRNENGSFLQFTISTLPSSPG